ncbi:MAG TPA: hypothetical protein VMO76_14840 [Candidatus Udaeobacter sp.]|nr:hypothetical protein [Candidatus Udaeobacter sp.]
MNSQFHSLLEKDIPKTSLDTVQGDLYYGTDSRNLYVSMGRGGLISLDTLWAGPVQNGVSADLLGKINTLVQALIDAQGKVFADAGTF